jgi:hypothetical protein
VRFDAPVVVKAFLTHDLATLQQHMGPELLEKLGGIFRHYEAQVRPDDGNHNFKVCGHQQEGQQEGSST